MTESPEESVQIIINIEDRPGLIEEAWGACDNCCTCGCFVIGLIVFISLVGSLAAVLVGCGVG